MIRRHMIVEAEIIEKPRCRSLKPHHQRIPCKSAGKVNHEPDQPATAEFFNGIRQFRSFPANWLVRAFREKPTFILHIGRTRRRSVQTNEVRKISKRLIPLPKVAL
jgi:hypothetical protein